MKEKMYHTCCGTIHYWASVSNPDAITLVFLPDFQHAETMTLEVEGKEPEVIRCPVDINGFEYEIREASRCVKLGRTGSDRYTPQDSLALTRLMYDTRMSWGMKFAGEV